MERRKGFNLQINPYEDEKLENLPDSLLRPGGFELTQRLVELADVCAGARILDLGCGVGGSVRLLSQLGYIAFGADKSEALIKRGHKLHNGLSLYTADAKKLPFEDSFFDAVLFECSLSLMDSDSTLNETRRVLKDGGHLLLSDIFSGTESYTGSGLTLYTLADFTELLIKNGFKLTNTRDETIAFESFAAQLIMSTGSLDTLFCCGEWREIKKTRPKYYLCTAYKM